MAKQLILAIMALISIPLMAQQPRRSDTVKVNGIELYYEVYGKGQPLVLLHGWTQSSQFWTEYISSFANDFEVYLVDLRGHGRSSVVAEDFSIRKAAEDVWMLWSHLKLEKVNAVGLSYGALVLLELATMQPEKLANMVLVSASPRYNGGENQSLKKQFSLEDLPPAFVSELRKNHHRGDAQIRAMFNPELNYRISLSDDDLNSIQCRTLIINGDHDEIMGLDGALSLFKKVTGARLWVVPGAGHVPITGAAKGQFIENTLTFLKGN